MSYLKDGVEYVTWDEWRVLQAVEHLNSQKRSTNNSQIARHTGLSTTAVASLTAGLQRRGYLKDISKSAAYSWRPTGKADQARLEPPAQAPAPEPAEDDTIMAHEAAARAAYAEYVRHTNRAVELMAQQAEANS